MYQKIVILIILLIISNEIIGQVSVISAYHCPIEVEQNNGKYRILNCTGKIILNDIDSIGFNEKGNFYIVKKNNKYGMFSVIENKIPVKFDKIERMFNWFWLVKLDGKYGVYSSSGIRILNTIYDEITSPPGIWARNAEFTVKKDGKYGIYNDKGNATVPIVYDKIAHVRGTFVLTQNNENHFLIGNSIIVKENILLEKTIEIYGDFPNETQVFYVFQKGYQQGILDYEGNVFMEPKYDDIVHKRNLGDIFPKNILLVKYNDKWGMTNVNDSIIIPIKYESIEFANPRYLILGINGMKQFYNFETQQIITDYDFERYVNLSKYSTIEKNGMRTLIDNETMKLLFPYKYEDISHNDKSNYFTVKLNNRYGIINSDGKEIVPIEYDNYLVISCGNKVAIKKNRQYGIIDLENNVLFPLLNGYIIGYSDYFLIKEIGAEEKKYDCNLQIQEEN